MPGLLPTPSTNICSHADFSARAFSADWSDDPPLSVDVLPSASADNSRMRSSIPFASSRAKSNSSSCVMSRRGGRGGGGGDESEEAVIFWPGVNWERTSGCVILVPIVVEYC